MLYGIAEIDTGYCVEIAESYDEAEELLGMRTDQFEIIEINEYEIEDSALWRSEVVEKDSVD